MTPPPSAADRQVPHRVDVLGVHLSAVNMAGAIDVISGWVQRRERQYVCITGVHGVVESLADPDLRAIHNDAGLVVPDGMPMVWSGRWAGEAGTAQVRGSDLMREVCQRAAREGWSVYFYGGAPEVLPKLEAALTAKSPGLKVAGRFSPPFRPLTQEELQDVVRQINAAGPDLVWVGLSTPKQERWMAQVRPLLDAPVLLGCGAAFDMNAGLLLQAPELLRRTGFEWAYRLYREPRRLWRRYAHAVPTFLLGVLRHPPRRVP